MHMKQSPYQLHPQQFLSSSSSFYLMLHMRIVQDSTSLHRAMEEDAATPVELGGGATK